MISQIDKNLDNQLEMKFINVLESFFHPYPHQILELCYFSPQHNALQGLSSPTSEYISSRGILRNGFRGTVEQF